MRELKRPLSNCEIKTYEIPTLRTLLNVAGHVIEMNYLDQVSTHRHELRSGKKTVITYVHVHSNS